MVVLVPDVRGNMEGRRGGHCKAYNRAKMAEPVEIPFRLWTWVGPGMHVLDCGTYWRHLADTVEPSMCGGDVAFLSSYFDHLLFFVVKLHSDTSLIMVQILHELLQQSC